MRCSRSWPLVVCALAVGVFAPSASARASWYCEKPDNAGAFLAASPSVTCATAARVKRRLISPACYLRTRCSVLGFRCVAYWDGSFSRSFELAHHAVCNNGWRWIEWDGG